MSFQLSTSQTLKDRNEIICSLVYIYIHMKQNIVRVLYDNVTQVYTIFMVACSLKLISMQALITLCVSVQL